MSEYQISYKISKNAKIMLLVLNLIFIVGIVIKAYSLYKVIDVLDIAYLAIFLVFFIFSATAILKFVIQKQAVLMVSSTHLIVAVPYFFQLQKLPLGSVKEIKMSVWGRSEIVIFDAGEFKSFSFMAAFLTNEERESFLANIFDLIPNVQVL